MAESNKRQAQSPLSGDEDDLKRRIIMEDPPILVSLDETSEEEIESSGSTELIALLQNDDGKEAGSNQSAAVKVDSLINRMDKFMECFANLHSTVSKNQNSNTRKFKRLEQAHNALATKVADSSNSMADRFESLESKLKETQAANAKLADKIKSLEDDQLHREVLQKQVNDNNSKKISDLEEEQGFVKKNMYDCRSETKERKLIISGVPVTPEEEVSKIALDSINKVIETAIAAKDPESQLGGLRKLHRGSVDNVYRIGKVNRGPFARNISVTFLRFDDKDMVLRAKSSIKGDTDVKIFFNEDLSADGRVLKAQLKRIAQVAKSQGKIAKVSGNKVTVDSRTYHSNELSLIPGEVVESLKYEKHIEDGIIFKGEKSVFSNFYPAPFNFEDSHYRHVEQYYQYCKAIHHNENQTAGRIMLMSNPRRIKALGDSIESNPTWLEQRMMVLYRGIKSKFEQNWPLQDELISSDGNQLYEATTDLYFGSGISYESPRWECRDWPGENVTGLILMKVREELLELQPGVGQSDNTLIDIASDENLNSSAIMDTQDGSLVESAIDHRTVSVTQGTPSALPNKDVINRPLSQSNSSAYSQTGHSDMTTTRASRGTPNIPYASQPPWRSRGSNRRGRGRGRGRNFRGNHNNSQQWNSYTKPKKQQNIMTDHDRNFLCGQKMDTNSGHGDTLRNSSPKHKNCGNPLGLNDQQIKGLALLGLSLPFGGNR